MATPFSHQASAESFRGREIQRSGFYKEVEKKWEATKRYFQDYKRFTRPFSVNLGAAIRGFDIDNIAAQQAIDESKALHARRWQTKEGTYWGGLCQRDQKWHRFLNPKMVT